MTIAAMTSMQRVLTTLGHKEPDRVPFFLLTTMHGAKELGLSIEEYYSKAEYVVEGQLRLRAKYHHDCLYPFFYAAVETEALGGKVIYSEFGPPNAGRPIIRDIQDIYRLTPPVIEETPCLTKVLRAIEMLKREKRDEVPIIGVVMSPFSLPVMQMGFEEYLILMLEQPDIFEDLMRFNIEFCVAWANAQVQAGAGAICYFDPVSSSTITTREQYLKTGFSVACRTISRIKAPTLTHFASGRCLPIADDITKTGTNALGVSVREDLTTLKTAFANKLAIAGNLDGIRMRTWTAEKAEAIVKQAIAEAGPGGGFILADNHGEIPYQVPDDVLHAVSEAVHKWGTYPLDWIKSNE
ncbi:MAG: methylcobamide--CoM methyltransferase MtbA [bacterium]|nr:methylcobamide--CoM methyltransferase MtbA [bacterium]